MLTASGRAGRNRGLPRRTLVLPCVPRRGLGPVRSGRRSSRGCGGGVRDIRGEGRRRRLRAVSLASLLTRRQGRLTAVAGPGTGPPRQGPTTIAMGVGVGQPRPSYTDPSSRGSRGSRMVRRVATACQTLVRSRALPSRARACARGEMVGVRDAGWPRVVCALREGGGRDGGPAQTPMARTSPRRKAVTWGLTSRATRSRPTRIGWSSGRVRIPTNYS